MSMLLQTPSSASGLAYPEARREDPMVREFSAWIHAEARHEGVDPESYSSG